MVRKKVLFFGPLTEPITGQSIAFQYVCDTLLRDNVLINTAFFGKKRVLNTLYSLSLTIFYFLTKRIDIVYFTASRSGPGFLKDYVLVLLSYLNSARIITHIHGADFDDFLSSSVILKNSILRTYLRVDTCIVLLDDMKPSFERFPNIRLETVFNCYGNEFEVSNLIIKEDITILYLSNIMMSKGILEFLASAKTIMSRYAHVKYSIAGSFFADEICNELVIRKKFYRQLHIIQDLYGKERIQFLGSVYGQQKVEIFQKSSIFILPTYYRTEAFPITLLEAMRMGNAIIATQHNYLASIINKRNGILVHVKSVNQLIIAQEELILNPKKLRAIQNYNVNHAKYKYNLEAFINNIESIIYC
jgi:glycosyltransferase involved in cell wall biosynthesis